MVFMNNLPFELLDSILLKSYLLHYVLKDKKSLKNKDHYVINQLASVDYCWFQRIRKKKFKNEMWRRLVVFYRRKGKMSSIYRNNRQYLETNIRLKGLVNRLKSSDFLTDVQVASLYRHNPALGTKDSFNRFMDVISDVEEKTVAIHSVFRRCLCDNKQHRIGEIVKYEGAVVTVEIKLTSVETPDRNLQIVKINNEICDKRKEGSQQSEEPMNKLKQDNMDILNASKDGDVIVFWIWCKTKHALENLQIMNKSKYILDVFTEYVKSSSTEERTPAMIKTKLNIDFEQFEKTIVVFFSISANFTSSLKLGWVEELEGLTKLRNKIHVLTRCYIITPRCVRCVILVFEDQIPICLPKRIEIKEIENPIDITSNEMENSLYVLDLKRCVWKINGDEMETVIRWLELGDYSDGPWTLSRTRVGQLLMVGQKKDDLLWSLRIFGRGELEKADLRLSISLPEDIQRPWHAVETSKGNFIIFHELKKRKEQNRGSSGVRRHMEELMEESMWVVSEVSRDGKTILRRFFPENEEQKLVFCRTPLNFILMLALDNLASALPSKKRKRSVYERLLEEQWRSAEEWRQMEDEASEDENTILGHFTPKKVEQIRSHNFGHLAVDSMDRVFFADCRKNRVILLDSDLQWNGILIPTEDDVKEERKFREPWKLFHNDVKKQLIVGGRFEVFVYTLNRK